MAEKGESSEAARKKKRLSLSLKRRKEENSASPLKKRFAKTSDQEMQSLKVKPMSKNTERSQRWALNVFKEWVRSNDWPEVEVERLWKKNLILRKFVKCCVDLLLKRNSARVNHTVPRLYCSYSSICRKSDLQRLQTKKIKRTRCSTFKTLQDAQSSLIFIENFSNFKVHYQSITCVIILKSDNCL